MVNPKIYFKVVVLKNNMNHAKAIIAVSIIAALMIASLSCVSVAKEPSEEHLNNHFVEFFGSEALPKVKILKGQCYHGMDDTVFLLFAVSSEDFKALTRDFSPKPLDQQIPYYFPREYFQEIKNLPRFKKEVNVFSIVIMWDEPAQKAYLNFQGALSTPREKFLK